jgi:hypothetical protein
MLRKYIHYNGYTVDGLPSFLQAEALKPFITEELMQSTTPIVFKLKRL